jgi:hypothetical protein
MSFDLETEHAAIVRFNRESDNVVAIRLEDDTVLYADSVTISDRQLMYAVDLLPKIVREELEDALREQYAPVDASDWEGMVLNCTVTHYDAYTVQTNLLYDNKARGWRVLIGETLPSLKFFSTGLGRVGEDGFGAIHLDSPIKEVFLTSRTVLKESSLR